MKVAWLLRGAQWRAFNLGKCLKCGSTVERGEPGAWMDNRSDEFPELCECRERTSWGTTSHTNCKASGPYCPTCASAVGAELLKIREMYRD